MGFPGYGGTGRRGRHGGSGASVGQGVGFPSFSGVVRWQSAKPILEAVKKPLPASFHGHYVIVVANIPLIGAGHGRLEGDASSDEALDNLRNLTTVKPKDQEPAGPAIVQQDSEDASVLWFGFSKETITISPADREVVFATEAPPYKVKAVFNLKDMIYRGALAV